MASHELTMLLYHFRQNLRLNDEHNMLLLGDDILADLDLVTPIRRECIPVKSALDGILPRSATTALRPADKGT